MSEREKLQSAVHNAIRNYCDSEFDFSFKPEDPIVRLHEPTFGADEIIAAVDCLLSTRITMGPKVKQFEREFADAFGHAHGIMNNSGSSANLLAVAALANPECRDGLKPGDEVIVPALSWSTTIWPLIQHGLVPVIVDIDPVTLNISPEEIERAIGPKTRAVMLVHVYGNPCDMDAINAICAKHNLTLIEDCCEALGAAYKGTPVGKFGRVGTFSFYYSHHITTLEGGICVTDDFELSELMRILRAHGWIREVEDRDVWIDRYSEIHPRFLFVNSGYNLRATDLQGAIGSVQLPQLAGIVERRRASADFWQTELANYESVLDMQAETPGGHHSWFGVPITLKADAPFTLNEFMQHLESQNIETRPIICGNIARQPGLKLYEHRVIGDLKHASHVMDYGMAFGNHQEVDDNARQYIALHLRNFMQRNSVA